MKNQNVLKALAALLLLCLFCSCGGQKAGTFRSSASSETDQASLTEEAEEPRTEADPETDRTEEELLKEPETSGEDETEASGQDEPETSGEDEPETVAVYVCGAVASPGVYELPAGSRAVDAVSAAGGLLKEAAGDFVNLADRVTDGEKLYIPYKEETAGQTPGSETPTVQQTKESLTAGVSLTAKETETSGETAAAVSLETADGRVDLNTADREALLALPGIGETKADAILEYREKYGPFLTAEDLLNVSGIGEATLDKIRDLIICGS